MNENMSNFNIGACKNRNIRDHLFVVYGIINSVLNGESDPVDIQIYDYKQCFDSLWLEECLNDMYEGGMKDNKLNLLHNANSLVNIVGKN